MSIYTCHKQQPQPWMSYISDKNICYTGECCPALVTNTTSLLPFQVVSLGSFIKMEVSPYRENDWSLITIPYTEVYIEGYYFISYNGEALAETLDCGAYDFKLTAGETWYFEPITVKDFAITENAYTIRDDLMLPFKFSEQQFETTPLIAPCDSFLPFMFSTENATSGTIAVYLYDIVADCVVTELTDIVVTILTIAGKTYYIHDGDCFYPFLECGIYKLEIVDGEHSYFSVPFDAVCNMNDIPDGYRVMLNVDRCVMRDENGNILYESCITLEPLMDYDNNIYTTVVINNQEWIIQNLKTTHYADGAVIPNIVDAETWYNDVTGAYRLYNDDIPTGAIYSPLYNWYAANNNIVYFKRGGIQEAGWRIPTETDFLNLIIYLGGGASAFDHLRETGIIHWNAQADEDNSTGFTALGAGFYEAMDDGMGGYFDSSSLLMDMTYFWSITENDASTAFNMTMGIGIVDVGMADFKNLGRSIRCVKDL